MPISTLYLDTTFCHPSAAKLPSRVSSNILGGCGLISSVGVVSSAVWVLINFILGGLLLGVSWVWSQLGVVSVGCTVCTAPSVVAYVQFSMKLCTSGPKHKILHRRLV